MQYQSITDEGWMHDFTERFIFNQYLNDIKACFLEIEDSEILDFPITA
jgi:hypothetical protein